jgi:hypothetical protein
VHVEIGLTVLLRLGDQELLEPMVVLLITHTTAMQCSAQAAVDPHGILFDLSLITLLSYHPRKLPTGFQSGDQAATGSSRSHDHGDAHVANREGSKGLNDEDQGTGLRSTKEADLEKRKIVVLFSEVEKCWTKSPDPADIMNPEERSTS